MEVYLSRFLCIDFKDNLKFLKDEVSKANRKGAEIVVFPEIFLTGYNQRVKEEVIEKVFKDISKKYKEILFVFGSYTKDKKNRLSVWHSGEEVAFYEKVHLFYPNGEDKIWEKGNFYSALNFKGKIFGFLVCNDIRFPEAARELKLNLGIDVLIVVAWWPFKRDHIWKKLLQARAIENNIWAVGCCISFSDYKGEVFSGALNYVFDPSGNQVFEIKENLYKILDKKIEKLVDTTKEFVEVSDFKLFKI